MEPGDLIEDFELPDQQGLPTRLSTLLTQGPVVLFFYPPAGSRGCTLEARHFRDLGPSFAELGATPVGISMDPIERQCRFSGEEGLDYPLLSDAGGQVAARFGVRRRFRPLPVRRTTFVVGPDQRLVAAVHSELSMVRHADAALDALRRWSQRSDDGRPGSPA